MEKKWLIAIIGIIIVLPLAWYLLSPLFIDKEVSEGFPVPGSDTPEMIVNNTLYQGQFIDADSFHKTSGQALIVSDGGKNYLRLEDFQTTNGPDLYVYLANDLDAEDYVSLGRLKGNIGSQNYEIPDDINPEDYKYVLIWCKAFSVLFGSAELQ